MAEAIAGRSRRSIEALLLVGLPASELLSAGRGLACAVAAEGFADRSYEPDGSLTPRQVKGSVICGSCACCRPCGEDGARWASYRARWLGDRGIEYETICVHGDTPDAAGLAAAVKLELKRPASVIAVK